MPVGYGHSGGDKRHHCGLDLCRSSEIASSGSTSSFPDFRTVSVPYITFYNDLGKLLNVESCRQAAVSIISYMYSLLLGVYRISLASMHSDHHAALSFAVHARTRSVPRCCSGLYPLVLGVYRTRLMNE